MRNMFLFPSSGKAFPNKMCSSIGDANWESRFYSLQAGRRFQTLSSRRRFRVSTLKSFYSLQAGRRFQTFHCRVDERIRGEVSIPFKREGVSELTNTPTGTSTTWQSFYSLQPGRRFQTQSRQIRTNADEWCFYSLPPGRRFQTFRINVIFTRIWSKNSFYSLQPGRRFQTETAQYLEISEFPFLFPSTGKAFPNFIAKSMTVR